MDLGMYRFWIQEPLKFGCCFSGVSWSVHFCVLSYLYLNSETLQKVLNSEAELVR